MYEILKTKLYYEKHFLEIVFLIIFMQIYITCLIYIIDKICANNLPSIIHVYFNMYRIYLIIVWKEILGTFL